jgi:4-amino-4-deoxy-L-arabinose transferase-like glycosyltransferase
MAMTFVPMWLVGGGLRRYVMPMYPMLAVICGAFVERAVAADRAGGPRRLWVGYVRTLAVVLIAATTGFGLATVAARFGDAKSVSALAQPWWTIGALVVAVGFGARAMLRSAGSDSLERAGRTALVAACLLAAVYNGPVMNTKAFEVVHVEDDVEKLRRALPPDVKLYSFFPAHHRFAYWYRDHIEMLPWPTPDSDLPEDFEYFVVTPWVGMGEVVLPFPWETLAWLSMDLRRRETPEARVLIGRRIRDPAPGGQKESDR